jgi:hypothetical protein
MFFITLLLAIFNIKNFNQNDPFNSKKDKEFTDAYDFCYHPQLHQKIDEINIRAGKERIGCSSSPVRKQRIYEKSSTYTERNIGNDY